jgi:DNA-binding SARP family transcriptional activator
MKAGASQALRLRASVQGEVLDMTSILDIHLLGDFHLLCDGVPLTSVNTARLQSLLAYLVLHRAAPQSRYYLAFLFWPDSSEAQARTNLRKLLHGLRQALPKADSFLEVSVQTLQWQADAPFILDVADFESAVAGADRAEQAGEPALLRDRLEKAVTLYRGDLLPSCYDDWIVPERERLSQAFAGALERLVLLLESQRDYEGAIGHAQRLLRHDPLNEQTTQTLMRLYALGGDRAGALRAYHAYATILQRELGVQPSPATHEAYERLVQAKPLEVPAPLPAGLVALVGRDREWAEVQKAWQAAAAGRPRLLLLTGEAGVGKTRLAEELLAWTERQGIAVRSARCYAAEGGLTYAPVAAWLRARPLPPLANVWLTEVARLLPELLTERPDLPAPSPLSEAWQRHRLFEALARALVWGSQPLLLLLDDVQWCGRETLEWLPYLIRFDPRARLLVVATMRAEEVGADHPLTGQLEALRRGEQLIEIELGPLDEAGTLALIKLVAGRKPDPALVASLYQGSEGNPLFVVEMARAVLYPEEPRAAEHGLVAARKWPSLLPKVRRVIEARLAQVSPPARELAGVAAVIGREFTFSVLSGATGGDENSLMQGLDELWRRRIVREQGADAYDFSHELIREVAYKALGAARQRVLHRQVAQALERTHAPDLDLVSAQLAAHYEQAGLPKQAVPYYLRAGEAARRIYATDEAMRWYRQALALIPAANLPDRGEEWGRQVVAPLHEGLGDVLSLTGQRDEARLAYRRALEQLHDEDPRWQARLWRKSANNSRDLYRYEEASESYLRAEGALGTDPSPFGSDWWREWVQLQLDRIWNAYWHGRLPEIAERVREVQVAVERYGTTAQHANFYYVLTLWAVRRDRAVMSEETLGHAQAALAASQAAGNLGLLVTTQFGLGFAHLWRRELGEAVSNLAAALALSERIGETFWRIRCLAYLSVAHRMRGEGAETQHFASRCLAEATAPEMLDYVGVARANLAWLAWRDGSADDALADGQAALACWDRTPTGYLWRWLALWPLMAASLSQGAVDEALGYASSMIQASQQALPSSLEAILEDALHVGQQGQVEAARFRLNRAVELAMEMRYL